MLQQQIKEKKQKAKEDVQPVRPAPSIPISRSHMWVLLNETLIYFQNLKDCTEVQINHILTSVV